MFLEARDFIKLVCSQTDHVRTLHEAARVFYTIQNYTESIEYLTRCALIEADRNAETYSDMARCIFQFGDKERNKKEGMEMVEKALKINDRCANGWLNKGNIQMNLGYLDLAKECYEKAK